MDELEQILAELGQNLALIWRQSTQKNQVYWAARQMQLADGVYGEIFERQ